MAGTRPAAGRGIPRILHAGGANSEQTKRPARLERSCMIDLRHNCEYGLRVIFSANLNTDELILREMLSFGPFEVDVTRRTVLKTASPCT